MNAINILQNLVKMEVSRWCIRQVLGFKQWKWLLRYKSVLTHPCIENLALNWTVLRNIGFGEICRSQGLHPYSQIVAGIDRACGSGCLSTFYKTYEPHHIAELWSSTFPHLELGKITLSALYNTPSVPFHYVSTTWIKTAMMVLQAWRNLFQIYNWWEMGGNSFE